MAPESGDTARLYHRLTSYEAEREWPLPVPDPRVLQDFVASDPARVPAPCKAYPPGLPVRLLPREWPVPAAPATAVLAGRPAPPSAAGPPGAARASAALSLPELARILHLSAGVVRASERHGRRWLFRAAGSAGGRFPLEVHVSARGVPGLDDGVHWYDPVDHALVRIGPPAGGDATALVVTGVPWRTGWKYAERGFRHVYWDAGTMLAQTLALAASAGLAPRLWTRFDDAALARLVGADGVGEFPVAVLGLAPGAPALVPSGDAVPAIHDPDAIEFPLVTRAQRAGASHALGAPWPAAAIAGGEPGAAVAGGGAAADRAPLSPPPSADLDTVILRRGSTRRLDATASLPREAFDFLTRTALGPARVPHFLAVHAVDTLAPGLYRWPDLDRPRRAGDLRERLYRVCWDQELGRDASFVAIAAADLARIDDAGYRDAQLEAGLVEGRLHLAAYALGLGASGMTFLDAEIEPLLGEPLAGLLFTCVGVPTYRHKAGGRPGEPVTVALP
ncbi:MAG TPA: hypothetical protein VNS09_07875 [Solirubrobacter sp.]|nr:hypothetical protein [Solirubrobacter sp.]